MRGAKRSLGVLLSGVLLLAGCSGSTSDEQQPGGGTGGADATGGEGAGGAAGVLSTNDGVGGSAGGTASPVGGTAGTGDRGTGGDPETGTGGADCPDGTERCSCYGNGTCNAGLVCASDLCVDLGTGGGAGAGGAPIGTGGGAGVGGLTIGTGGGAGVGGAGAGGAPASGGSAGTGGACTNLSVPVDLVPVNLVFIVDSSGSMGVIADYDFTPTRWVPVRDGLLAFLNEPASRRHYASLEFFPAPGDLAAACDVAAYEAPAVDLTALDSITATNSPFLTAFNDTTPAGGTPTLPALLGSLNYARSLELEDPDANTVVVMFTDGLPVFYIESEGGAVPGCTEPLENTVENTATIAAEGLADGIPTYVIGITDDPNGLSAVQQIAIAGGTSTATVLTTDDPAITTAEIQAELANIRSYHRSCSVPAPEVQSTVDWEAATVLATVDGIENVLARSRGCADGLGWQYLYSVDTPNTPSHIELCPDTCETIQGLPEAELSVDFGCLE